VSVLGGEVLFSDRSQFGLGIWSFAVKEASIFAGWPRYYAVLALAGGGGLLAASAFQFSQVELFAWSRTSRERRHTDG
jgi:hypothetical protein